MIKEIFDQEFPFNRDVSFTYTSNKYLDIITNYNDEGNLVFEFTVKNFDKPFSGKIIRKSMDDFKEYPRFFAYVNQNGHKSGYLSVGFQSLNIYKIWDVLVEPSFQHLGIGTELVKYAERQAKEWSAKVIIVECPSSNYPAIKFFQKNNFNITGFNLIHNSRDDLKKHDFLIIMSKLI